MKKERKKRGPIIGVIENRHEPPTLGHKFMVTFAKVFLKTMARIHRVDWHLHLIVCSRDSESISGKLRFELTKELFAGKNVSVHHCHNIYEKFPELDYDGTEIWGRVITDYFKLGPVDYIFASEDYGPGIAKLIGAKYIQVDKQRSSVPVSGTEIRNNPMKHWHLIDPLVRVELYLKKVCIVGPEYSGKDDLAEILAKEFNTRYTSEYAKAVYDSDSRNCRYKDIKRIAIGQIAAEESLALQANRVLICNNLISTYVWSKDLFNRCPAWISKEADERLYDLYLFVNPDKPKKFGNSHPDYNSWKKFKDKLKAELNKRGIKYITVTGFHDLRVIYKKIEELIEQ